MPFASKAVCAAVALSVVSLCLAPAASAGPKEDVAASTQSWARALGEDDPDKVVPLYSEDAVLWGTLSPTVRADRAALRDYFVTAFKVLPGLKVAFGDQLIRVYGGTAGKTRHYTFSFSKAAETNKVAPARRVEPDQGRCRAGGQKPVRDALVARDGAAGLFGKTGRLVQRTARHAALDLDPGQVPGRERKDWSGRRDSNPRPQPWQGCALPLSYTRILIRPHLFAGGSPMPNGHRLCNRGGHHARAGLRCRCRPPCPRSLPNPDLLHDHAGHP